MAYDPYVSMEWLETVGARPDPDDMSGGGCDPAGESGLLLSPCPSVPARSELAPTFVYRVGLLFGV